MHQDYNTGRKSEEGGGKNSVVTLDLLKVKVQCIEYLFYNNTSMYLQVCACLGPDINTTLFSVLNVVS